MELVKSNLGSLQATFMTHVYNLYRISGLKSRPGMYHRDAAGSKEEKHASSLHSSV